MEILLMSGGFGQKLRHLRMKAGLSQKALAARLGVSIYRIRMIEDGRIRRLEEPFFRDLCEQIPGGMEELFRSP